MKIKNSRALKNLLSTLCGVPLSWVRYTWRVTGTERNSEAEALLQSGKPVIYALWHGRMYCLFKAVPIEKVAILVSPSNDGEFITRIAQCIGFRHFVRGSHKRGGVQAILGLHKALAEDGLSVAFTVDGPRGPRYQVKPGIIRLASQTGAPIIPLTAASKNNLAHFEKSWDHFQTPLPYTRLQLAYGQPLYVPPDLPEAEIAEFAKTLEAELYALSQRADAVFGYTDEHL